MPTAIDYAKPGPLTDLASLPPSVFATLPTDPAGICRPVHHLVIQPDDARALGLAESRLAENQLRSSSRIVQMLLAQNPAPLDVAREPGQRVVGCCRHFAVLSCALLRRQAIPARVRCGFATYFQPGKGLDHWVTEYWHQQDSRWVRIDSEIIGGTVLDHPEDLAQGQFLTGGEAWQAYRQGRIDASQFGVPGTENFGPGEIRGNAIRDLAALNKIEMLPWDEWGRMELSYQGKTGSDFDELMDVVAVVCAAADPTDLAELYANAELQAPVELIH